MSLMRTNDAGEDHHINDVLLHCMSPSGEGLTTLCGLNYENVLYTNWAGRFVDFEGGERCPACVAHPDLPLALLAEL
jgi:hypothetical protein